MNNLERNETMTAGFPHFMIRRKVDPGERLGKKASGYKLAIFDFDGTLADSFAWFLSVINEVADRYGFRRIEERK